MSHSEQLGFFSAVLDVNRVLISSASVLEIGSYDVNGSVRGLFTNAARYTGVDLAVGPGVDLVALGHIIDHPDGAYDVTISAECFEHDPHWRETFRNMARMTRPGGMVAFSCASTGRPEHGTMRTDRADSPGTQAVGFDYYSNLAASDFEELSLGSMFCRWRFWYLPTHFDLYFVGQKLGPGAVTFPKDQTIRDLRRLMPLRDRLSRVPMRALAKRVSAERYQTIILPVWKARSRLPG